MVILGSVLLALFYNLSKKLSIFMGCVSKGERVGLVYTHT